LDPPHLHSFPTRRSSDLDGSYHDVDSNEMSFKMAGILAFRNVSPNCRPVLLEPILELDVSTPDDYQGAVMGDLSSRRGQILGTEPDGRLVRVKALVPEAELDRYATTLHSITHGRGTYRAKFHVYQEVRAAPVRDRVQRRGVAVQLGRGTYRAKFHVYQEELRAVR